MKSRQCPYLSVEPPLRAAHAGLKPGATCREAPTRRSDPAQNGPQKTRATPLYVRKQRELAIYDEDLENFYLSETKSVTPFPVRNCKKTRGEDMKVSPIMLLKTHVEKMSETGHAIICLKTKHLKISRHYIDDNKRS